MRFSLFAPAANPFFTPEMIQVLGREADERGIDTIWVPEHVVLFDEYASSYPYADDGRIPAPPGSGILDPMTTLSFLAACSEHVRLGTGISLLAQRNPVYTAKEVATVDYLSNGRVDFGIGVGWLREEFQALMVPWERRGKRTDEYLEVLRTLWCDEISSFAGEFYQLPECRQDPKPAQQPHPPLWFGGESEAAQRRVARSGHGWYSFKTAPDQLATRVKELGDILAEHGRSIEDVEVNVCPYFDGIDPAKVEAYAEAGATQVTALFFAGSADEVSPALDALTPCLERARQLT
jgi:probable F420-dependent oxidoreductase